MNVIPAKVAGVDNIIMTTPPGKDGKVYPVTLVAANEAGVVKFIKLAVHRQLQHLPMEQKQFLKLIKL